MVPENNIKIRKVNDMNQVFKQRLWQIKTPDSLDQKSYTSWNIESFRSNSIFYDMYLYLLAAWCSQFAWRLISRVASSTPISSSSSSPPSDRRYTPLWRCNSTKLSAGVFCRSWPKMSSGSNYKSKSPNQKFYNWLINFTDPVIHVNNFTKQWK